jgi:diguanylate cyclase
MRYSESTTQNAEILRLVIPFLAKHKLAATPIAYTVCYEYFVQTNPAVRRAIDAELDARQELKNEFINGIFERYISGADEINLLRINEEIRRVINELCKSTASADYEASRFTQSLVHYGDELEAKCDDCSIEKIVQNLLADTRIMQAVAVKMQAQMDDSKREIQLLRDQLVQLRTESLTDALTGLTNRKGFTQKIEAALAEHETLSDGCCVLMVDIDRFKAINDTFGHLIGDKVIQFVATTMRKQVKGKDTVARFGGDEYIILLPETTLAGAISVGENIRSAIEKTRIKRLDSGEPIGSVTVSIGVAEFQAGESVNQLLNRADAALYQSKNKGRNRVTTIDRELFPLKTNRA